MAVKAPVGLAARGKRMWTETLAECDPGAAHRVLLEEACRIADRLEALDRIIRGLGGDLASGVSILGESRQQSLALQRILTEVRQGARKNPLPQQGGSGVANLADKIAQRRKAAKG